MPVEPDEYWTVANASAPTGAGDSPRSARGNWSGITTAGRRSPTLGSMAATAPSHRIAAGRALVMIAPIRRPYTPGSETRWDGVANSPGTAPASNVPK